LTVSVLAGLWALSALVYGAGGLGLAFNRGLGGAAFAVSVAGGLLLAIFSGAMAVGLFGRRGWARVLQIAAAAIGVLSCVFTLSSITVLVYMLRPATSIHFSGRPPRTLSSEEAETAADTSAETAFTAAILGTVLLGGGLLSVVAFLAGRVDRAF
jgi:hypothetical protein